MKNNIRILDCTLRDGGHVVGGYFGKEIIKGIIEKLVEAQVDIIEVGFLWEKYCGSDYARYTTIEQVKEILPEKRGKSKFSLMADFIDLSNLEENDGTIEYIRLSFKRWRLEWGINTAKILMEKGYKVFINPVNNNVYSDAEYIQVLERVNELHPYGFSIVDTFGVMRINDLSHRYYLVEKNLNPDITIGVHLHENLGLAYSLAQHIAGIASPRRHIVIDGSLLGMGRVPGNLCIEQIMDFLNEQYGTNYILEAVYDAIDDYIAPIKETNPWGYAIPYALSAKYKLHRTYAEYLMKKQRLKTKDIQRILAKVSQSEAETFNEDYIEKLYSEYMNVEYDDANDVGAFQKEIMGYNSFLVIAPGKTIRDERERIMDIVSKDMCVIAVNFVPNPSVIKANYVFLTNEKRYDGIKGKTADTKLIITSNLIRDIHHQDYTVAYNNLVYHNDVFCDDSTLMLLSLLNRCGITKVYFAGFDGSDSKKLEYFEENYSKANGLYSGELIKKIIKENYQNVEKIYVTSSVYDKKHC